MLVFLCACGSSRPRPEESASPEQRIAPRTGVSDAVAGGPVVVGMRDASVRASSSAPGPLSSAELRLDVGRLESEYRYEEAVQVLDALLELGPGDATSLRRRRATLEAFLELAEHSYARAEAAADPAEEAFHLALIRSFWPGYRDVEERLLALRAAKSQGGS